MVSYLLHSFCLLFYDLLLTYVLVLVGTVAMNFGFALPSDDEQTLGELATTQVIPTVTEPVIAFTRQPNPEVNANVADTSNLEVDTTSKKKMRQAPGEKSSDSAWSVCFDPIRPSQTCFNDPEAAQRAGHKSRPPADSKLLKDKPIEEVVDELAHCLFQVNLLAYDVHRRALKSEPKARDYDELKNSYDAQMSALENKKIMSEQRLDNVTKELEEAKSALPSKIWSS